MDRSLLSFKCRKFFWHSGEFFERKIGVVTEKKFLQGKSKFSSIETFVYIYYHCGDVIMEIRFFSFLYDKCSDISITVIDTNLSIGENLDIIFIYLFNDMLNVSQ